MDPELWEWAICGSKVVHLPQTRTFWEKSLILFSSTYWLLSFFKILWVMRMCHFWIPTIFFRETCWQNCLLSFMPIYIPKIKVRYQSINEILTIKQFWNIIVQEPFLAITWESDLFQAYSLCWMLKDHMNLPFTLIPDKNSNLVFQKV